MQHQMNMSYSFLFALFGFLSLLLLVQSQYQSGFISIDCGLPGKSSYTEETTSINYISDANFIDTGVSKALPSLHKTTHQQQLWYVRSFPEGERNCYRINITRGTRYLIRASFLYGNYDGLNQLPQFDLHFGPNLWEAVKLDNVSLSTSYEIIHVPSLDYIHICLINTDSGTPFISAIELRTLDNTTYITQSGSLSRFLRLDLGSVTNRTYRYKDDALDRFWSPYIYNKWAHLSTAITANNMEQNFYQPPIAVMSTAATPVNASASFDFYWEPMQATDMFYLYLHFAEIEELSGNETRSFNISLNGKYWYGPVTPVYLTLNTVYTRSALKGGEYKFSLYMTETSTRPPILNAVEVYTVKEFLQVDTNQRDVDAITNIKSFYGVARNWQGDPCVPVSYLWEGLNCSDDENEPPRITSLDLSSTGLTGEISTSIAKLTMLEYLDLSNNSLSGPIPEFLSELKSLRILKLEKNNFTGSVPSELATKSHEGSLTLSVDDNTSPCGSASCNTKKKKSNNILVPVIAAASGFFVLLLIFGVIFCILKKRTPPGAVTATTAIQHSENPIGSSLETRKREYAYPDLVKITNNFSKILGKGGFGTVYHGYIDDIPVAVKMLSASSVQGYQQFQAEVKLLLRVHHRNLTSLIGYCNEDTNMGLIYEYMEKGNLGEHISGLATYLKNYYLGFHDIYKKHTHTHLIELDWTGESTTRIFLTWEDRLRIGMEAAQGLEYLHNGCKPPIIHRDVKSTNILLNEQFQAKLADFGLSKIFPIDGGTHVSTVVAGTPGYLDPEYYISNRLTDKSDVYSFGVVLLELITSLPVISRTQEKTHISQLVSFMLAKGDIKGIVDSRLHGDYEINSVWKAVELAMACVSPNSTKRPSMSEVVSELKECLATELGRSRPGCSGTETKDSIELVSMNLTTELSPSAR